MNNSKCSRKDFSGPDRVPDQGTFSRAAAGVANATNLFETLPGPPGPPALMAVLQIVSFAFLLKG